MKYPLVTLLVLPLLNSSALASGFLSDVQLDDICSGSTVCHPTAQFSGNYLPVFARVNLLNPSADNRTDLEISSDNSTPSNYTLLTGEAAASKVRALLNSK